MSERSCSNCGAEIPAQAQFCTRCGTPSPLDQPEQAPSGPPASGPPVGAHSATQAAEDDVNATRSFAVGGQPAPPPPPDAARTTLPPPPPGADLPRLAPDPPEDRTQAMGAAAPHPAEPPTQVVPPTQAMPPAAPWSPPGGSQPAPSQWQGRPPEPAPAPWQGQPPGPGAGAPQQQWQPPAGAPQQQWQPPAQPQWSTAGHLGGSPASSRERSNLPAGLLALLGGVLLCVGVFGQWVRTNAETFNGWSASPDAKVVLGLGIAALIVGGLLLAGVRHVALRFVLIALGVAALVYAVVDMLSVGSDVAGSLNPAIGWGLFLLPVGGLALIASGLLARHARRSPPPSQPQYPGAAPYPA